MSLYDLLESLSATVTNSPVVLASKEVVNHSIRRSGGVFRWVAKALSLCAGVGAFVMNVGAEVITYGLRITAYGFIGWFVASVTKELTAPVVGAISAVGGMSDAAA